MRASAEKDGRKARDPKKKLVMNSEVGGLSRSSCNGGGREK